MNERLIDLLVEFDEMGLAPTIPCKDIEGAAKAWREKLIKEVKALEAENAVLREIAEYLVDNGGAETCSLPRMRRKKTTITAVTAGNASRG